MGLTYKKLWKLLIDRDMNKSDLRTLTGISQSTMAKIGKNESINTSILERICKELNCDIADIMEYENIE